MGRSGGLVGIERRVKGRDSCRRWKRQLSSKSSRAARPGAHVWHRMSAIMGRPTRPLPSMKGWIDLKCTWARARGDGQAMRLGVQEALEIGHGVSDHLRGRGNEDGVPGPVAEDPVLRATERPGPCCSTSSCEKQALDLAKQSVAHESVSAVPGDGCFQCGSAPGIPAFALERPLRRRSPRPREQGGEAARDRGNSVRRVRSWHPASQAEPPAYFFQRAPTSDSSSAGGSTLSPPQ